MKSGFRLRKEKKNESKSEEKGKLRTETETNREIENFRTNHDRRSIIYQQ